MVALKLRNFGGMIPATDSHLLPDDFAGDAQNAWLQTGAIKGFHTPTQVHTLGVPAARKAFRIPKLFVDKDHINDSYWLEFLDQNTDVIVSPVSGDTFSRFYWASPSSVPQYNTKARIAAGSSPYTLGIPTPETAPAVARVQGAYYLTAEGLTYIWAGGNTRLYDTEPYDLDRGSFEAGKLVNNVNALAGSTKAIKTNTSGVPVNVDQSAYPLATSTPANMIYMTGKPSELRYGTSSGGLQVTIDEFGVITIGVPPQPTNTPPYVGIGVLEVRAYVYTWVSTFGEEGPPSPPALQSGYSGDPWIVKVAAPLSGDTTNRSLAKVNIYRTVTGSAGDTAFFFVAQMDIGTTVYTDTTTDDDVSSNSILESIYWSSPPTDLQGITLMANGIIAGFRNNEIWFCEPYRPHAWPAPYVISVESTVVGFGTIGTTLFALTTGSPFAITGINPGSMAVSRIAAVEPCLSRGSILSTPEGVVYASPNGLVLALPGMASVITKKLFTKDEWQDLVKTPTLRSSMLTGGYYTYGSVAAGCFDPNSFDNGSFLMDDFTGAYSGAFIDYKDQRIAFTRLASDLPIYNTFTDFWTGEVFSIKNGSVYWLDISSSRGYDPFLWHSKTFETMDLKNFEAMRVYFSTFSTTPALNPVPNTNLVQTLASDQYGLVRVYADGVLRYCREIRNSGEFFRLPSGFKASFWEFEIEARVQITNFEVATSAKELNTV